jgi:GNAT superfamily N-acetyltransferase
MPALEITVTEGPLSRSELNEVAQVAARAFHTDPFFIHLSPDAMLRARGLGIFFRGIAKNIGPKGLRYVARCNGQIIGVAVYLPPGAYPLSVGLQVAQLATTVRALIVRPKALIDGTKYLAAMDKAHPKEEGYYLQLLATDPEFQGRGVGTALQAAVLEHCDQEQLHCYLETQKEDNLAYYRRFGHELRDTLRPVPSGPVLSTMLREPQGP